MANKEIFSKHIKSNVKLATRYDAEGREVQVERREDTDATAKEKETFDLLINAGYYRACIKGLSAFDKVVGGMTWCIECCDYDVDVDLLFHENLTIGQKISLVEKIVAVLPQMKCPFRIEPHQIQGLEFLCIHPVIQWLVKKSVENRAERNMRLKQFAIGQFHNNYQYKSDKQNLEKIRKASVHIKRIQEMYNPVRQYQRKEATDEDERTKVQLTLLEYGNLPSVPRADSLDDEGQAENVTASEDSATGSPQKLDNATRYALRKHYKEFKHEMETDTKQLTEQNQIKSLEATKLALEQKLERNQKDVKDVMELLQQECELLEKERAQKEQMEREIEEYKRIEGTVDAGLLEKVQGLLRQHDELKKEESEFKEHCRKDLAALQEQIEELEAFNAQDPQEREQAVAKEKERIQLLKLQLAKRNRGILAIQQQLDNTPDRTELAQYQRRFHELYNEMSAKHLETKQYYTLFNTLNDQKRYMEKELSLLNSICEAYNEGMSTQHGREEFIQQFEQIVQGVKQTEQKVKLKFMEEKKRRDALNEELQGLLELQRQYAAAVKQLTIECQRCEQLQQHLKSIHKKL
ncbi:coiled-coil domain-containing protein 93 isoform X2 [Musca domestica]|uniref:Coiled-coil domain-containing protein 93 n=1 Tax=Musca domestica TaxID=7370 RepID=A0ABM3VML9_MUSDO|nr:coiled-coil domain-containing protein 93 isoform X2 [Musca domestica]